MKKGLGLRLISLILTAALLFSSLSVLSFAASGATASGAAEEPEFVGEGDNVLIRPEEGVNVQFYRSFDDGYGLSDGFTSYMPKAHLFELAETDGNKYLKMTARMADGATKTSDGYIDFYFDKSADYNDTLVVKFDVFFDNASGIYPGVFVRFRDLSSSTFRGLALNSSGAKFLNKTNKSGYYNSTKHTVAYTIKTTATDNTYSKVCSAYIDGVLLTSATTTSAYALMESIRIGFFSNVPVGATAGIDNFTAYTCDETVKDPLNVDLGYTMGSSSDRVLYRNELFTRVGVDMALSHSSKLYNTAEPFMYEDKPYLPVETLAKHLGYSISLSGTELSLTKSGASTITLTPGSYNATVGGKTVSLYGKVANTYGYMAVYYRDVEKLVPGYYGSYNDMGVIVVSEIEGYATIASDNALLDVMKRFNFKSIDENKNQVNVISKADFASATSAHPYILANEDDFTYYRSIYAAGKENNPKPELYAYISALVKKAETAYGNYKKETNGVCTGISAVPTMPHNDYVNNGYDPNGGRQTGADTYAERMQLLAFGYQITENPNYARLAYHYAIALGQWEHWGPAHFLNCADAAGPFAIAYDWLYNGWTSLGLDVKAVREILFTHGVLAGWYAVEDVECPWARRKSYTRTETTDSSHFYKMENNWNAVCSAGMTAAALALAGDGEDVNSAITVHKATLDKNTGTDASRYPYIYFYEDVPFTSLGDHTGLSTYTDYSYHLFTRIQYTLPLHGLDFYAPDGSYVESPTYWAYSANNLFAVGAYCDSVFGDDFGLITNCWGLDETCYYAINAQSSDYALWNYSDSSSALVPGAISSTSFPYVSYQLGLPDLAQMRKEMLESSKYSVSYLDVFYYSEDASSYTLPELQYHMESIDGFVARDSWEPGSTYIAIKGGYNDSAHGQVDSGEFVYHNNGKIWFCDIGTEGYNVSGFGGSVTGYQYYRMNAEGNNTLAITTNPLPTVDGVKQSTTKCCFAGQYSYGTGYMYETGDNEFGAYALIDQTTVYYDNAKSAKRGMLFTNDRKTVVIQDEVTFKEAETVYWIGHTYQDIYVTTGGRCAYMTDGDSTIRVTLLSSNEDLRFDVLSAYDFILEDTFRPDYATTHGTGVAESDRSVFKRLTVKCEDVTELQLAVVIEDVTDNDEVEVGYEYTPMDSWIPTEDGRPSGEVDVTVDFDESYHGYETNGELEVYHTDFFSDKMLTVATNESTTPGSYAAINLPRAAFASAALAGDYLVLDIDAYTDSTVGDLALTLIGGSDNMARAALSGFVKSSGEWTHITIIATAEEVLFFSEGKLVLSASPDSTSFEALKIAVTQEGAASGAVSLDNIRARRISSRSGELAEHIAAGSIAEWKGYSGCQREDAPVLSYMGERGLISSYTFSSLSGNIPEGKEITIYTGNEHAPMTIDKACIVVHGDYAFRAESSEHSAFIDSGTTEFKTSEVTVYWHIGAVTETSTVVGINYAVYNGSNSSVGKITESVVDGKSIFNATGWSLTEGGKLASKEDMLVTSENCHFYMVEAATDYPYFYESSGGDLVPRGDTSTFFADLLAGHKRVILNRDLDISGAGNTLSKKALLYLNGYTLSFNLTSGSHMFTVKNGNLSIYGGGGKITKTGSGNIFFPSSYKAYTGIDTMIYVENATLESTRSMMDQRTGHVYFKNVVFNQIGEDETILVVQNRTNSMTTENTMPRLTLDGCIVNHYTANTSTYAISISKNSRLNITGGTHINIPTGIALRLHNAYTSGGSTEAFVDYSSMSLTVEDAYFNAKEIYIVNMVIPIVNDGLVSYSAAYTVHSNKIFDESFKNTLDETKQEHALNMASKLQIGNMTRSSINTIPSINLAEGCIFARQTDPSAPYISTDSYATVTWAAGDKSVVEYWLNGSLPTVDNEEVKANLAALNENVEAGKKYTYSVGVAEGEVTFTATKFDAFKIAVSLTLESSMKANVFVEYREDVAIHGFYLDGEEKQYTMTEIDGVSYYKITTPHVNPTSAATKHRFTVYITDSDGGVSPVSISFSVVDYADSILCAPDKYGREAIGLMANILYYIDAAFKYVGLTETEDYKTVRTVLSNHINKVTYSVVDKTEAPDLSGVKDAIRSIQVLLFDSPKYCFNIKAGYTGKLVIHYTVYGRSTSKTYNVVDGLCDGKNFIEFAVRAYDFRSDITIETEDGSGAYNLRAYYNATLGMDHSLTALLNALYAYSEKAEEYKLFTQQS